MKVIINTFTDPMMGLSYECEPLFRRLEAHYGDSIEFRYVMSGLVRDVYQFVDKTDLRFGKEEAIKRYNKRLAKIYEDEESISGMPINMNGFCLFDTEHTSSIPLDLAYKAVQCFHYCDSEKAAKEIHRVLKSNGLILKSNCFCRFHSRESCSYSAILVPVPPNRFNLKHSLKNVPNCLKYYNFYFKIMLVGLFQ